MHHWLISNIIPEFNKLMPNFLKQALKKLHNWLSIFSHPEKRRYLRTFQQLHCQHCHEKTCRSKKVVSSLRVSNFKSFFSLFGMNPIMQIKKTKNSSSSKIGGRILDLKPNLNPFFWLSPFYFSVRPQATPNFHKFLFMILRLWIIRSFSKPFDEIDGIFPTMKCLEGSLNSKSIISIANVFDCT